MRPIDARVADVLIDARRYRRNAEFQRSERRVPARHTRRQLIHRNAIAIDIDAQRLGDRGAGEEARHLHVVAIAAHAALIPKIGEHGEVLLQVGQGFQRRRHGEARADLGRSPGIFAHAVGHVERGEAHRWLRIRSGRHSFQPRQTQGHAHASQ